MVKNKKRDYNKYNKTKKGKMIEWKMILEARNIEKYYGSKSNLTKAIDNISFEVKKGEFVGIMGASGSRKNNTFELYFYNRQSYSRKNNN